MEIVLLGDTGRDDALVDRLPEDRVHVIGRHYNPGLVGKVGRNGGTYHLIDDITDVETVADIVEAIKPDMFLTNFDKALAAGVVDVISRHVRCWRLPGLLMPEVDQAAAKIESDKFYLRKLINEINPKYNPINFMVESAEDAMDAIGFFALSDTPIVIKPRNLADGKGVKVMGKHFETYQEGESYAVEVLLMDDQSGLEVQEKLEGPEFNLQLITDGKVIIKAPVTYDYPYREDGDLGPGIGGMGAFSMRDGLMPFLKQADYDEAYNLMVDLLAKLKERGVEYRGVLYPSFIKTVNGIKIVEVNARGGNPEFINTLDLMEDDVDFSDVLRQIAMGELREDSVRYKKLASAVVYLVTPSYGYSDSEPIEFSMNKNVVSDYAQIRFSGVEKLAGGGDRYRSVGSSRVLALSSQNKTPWAAQSFIKYAIESGFDSSLALEHRRDIGSKEYIRAMMPPSLLNQSL